MNLFPNTFLCLPTAHCRLPTADCPLPTAHCLMPTAYCPLPHYPLPFAMSCRTAFSSPSMDSSNIGKIRAMR
uniref:Uncharacterized protein n=1 Tax=Desulfatirhabdium butyrativorans TaxID=340467 RepID=A0A7C4MKW7_9BACT